MRVLAAQHRPASVPVQLNPRVRNPGRTRFDACTLSGADQQERMGQWCRLLPGAPRPELIAGGLRIQLPAERAGPVADLAAAE